jgi:hypothetical protein
MKGKTLIIAVLMATGLINAQAQTTFTNLNGDIGVAGNWDNGLPDGVQGTIDMDAVRTADVNWNPWNILQTGGNVVDTMTNYRDGTMIGGTVYEIQGGSYTRTNSSLRLGGDALLKISGGSAVVLSLITTGSYNLEVNSGSFISQNALKMNNGAKPASINISGGTVQIGVANSSATPIDEANIFFNVSGGSLEMYDLSYGTGANDTNIVVTIRGDGLLTTHNFDQGGNATAQADRYINFESDADASWIWTGTNQAAFVSLWDQGTLRHNGLSGLDGETFSENFSVTGDMLTVIPEPGTIGMVLAAGTSLIFIRRRLMI